VINFSGYAVDAQDGVIANANLVWSSAAGPLGAGPLLTQNLLPPGADVITLTATNSHNLSASAHVIVYVDDNIQPDGPTLQIAPGSIVWSIGSGVTSPQTQTLTASNLGTGSLTWQVSSDAAWLTVSKSSGNQGETLVATGDPSGLKDGQTRSGDLAFTTTSNGVLQTLHVTVTLIRGNVYQSPYTGPQPALKIVYLPIVLRQP
jgi:hypothetical protein